MLQPSLSALPENLPVTEAARGLLGARLVRRLDDRRLAGTIIETEAYQGESDLACHARAGCTTRTEVMYGPPGRAYVYLIYGMHWMLNVVCGPVGTPEAVLIRAILPMEGLDEISRRRPGVAKKNWTDGPAKLCKALAIDGRFNGIDLNDPQGELFIEAGDPLPEASIRTGPRVGIENVPEPWRSMPWRYQLCFRGGLP
jgi:DNA-3-methyladenine glycosylase